VKSEFALSLLLVGLAALQTPAPQVPSTFRAGVDVVALDVTVLDKDRETIRGLTAADFTILEGRTQRPIVAFDALDLP